MSKGFNPYFMGTKYKAQKTVCIHGHTHDSKREAERCDELHFLLKAKVISDLELQKSFELIPSQNFKERGMPNERAVTYKADFVYKQDGILIVEDSKGMKTKDYIIKRKLFKQKYCQNGDIKFIETT